MTVVSKPLIALRGPFPDLLRSHAVQSTFSKGFQAFALQPNHSCTASPCALASARPSAKLRRGIGSEQTTGHLVDKQSLSNLGNRLEPKARP